VFSVRALGVSVAISRASLEFLREQGLGAILHGSILGQTGQVCVRMAGGVGRVRVELQALQRETGARERPKKKPRNASGATPGRAGKQTSTRGGRKESGIRLV